jgi:hypothetical protein
VVVAVAAAAVVVVVKQQEQKSKAWQRGRNFKFKNDMIKTKKEELKKIDRRTRRWR